MMEKSKMRFVKVDMNNNQKIFRKCDLEKSKMRFVQIENLFRTNQKSVSHKLKICGTPSTQEGEEKKIAVISVNRRNLLQIALLLVMKISDLPQ